VTDLEGWTPATDLVSGAALPELFAVAARRWNAQLHAAATLAWKSYTYWLTLPVVLSWATNRRVPLVDPHNILVRLDTGSPLLQVGFRRLQLAVPTGDPMVQAPEPYVGHDDSVAIVGDDQLLLKAMRMSLLDHHLEPLAEQIQERVKVGRHNLRGSIASGIAYGVIRAGKAIPGSAEETITTLLEALGLHDLVELLPGAEGKAGLEVQRKTCCLAFTLPEPKICSGCCLRKC
jgi:ferric iron reductase protein FhuF